MFATKAGSRRHSEEAKLLERALAGQPMAAESMLNQLGSANHWLQQAMMETIQDSAEPLVWQRLLACLALHRWGDTTDTQRRVERETSERIDAAIVHLFVSEEGAPSAPVKQSILLTGLSDADCHLRYAAATLLAFRSDSRGIESIIEAVRTGDRECSLRAMEALGRLKDERGGWVLAEVLGCNDDALHSEAACALVELDGKALPAVLEALKSPKPHVRWHAVQILGRISDGRAAAGLAEALADSDYSVRWAAADALAGLGPLAVPKILERLSRYAPMNDVYQVAHHALRQISQAEPPEVQMRLQPLLKVLHDPSAPVAAPVEAYRLLQKLEAGGEGGK